MVYAALIIISVSVFLALEYSSTSGQQIKGQLRRAGGYTILSGRDQELARSARERLIDPLIGRLGRFGTRLSPQASRVLLAHRLQVAGLRISPQAFLAVKGGLVVSTLGVGFVGGLALHNVVITIVGFGTTAVSWIAPEMFVGRRTRARREAMERSMPDTLDLLTVSVEAGLGFDAAINKVTEKMSGPLVDEMALMAREIRIGETRRQALKSMAERSDSETVASFCRSIIQADELGTSLGRTLRVQAVDMRIKRQLDAEEKAMKAPIKMLFPTVLFIFPAMFIVILGPAFINIMKTLKGVV